MAAQQLKSEIAPMVRVEKPEAGIAVVTLDTPKKRNCLSRSMMAAIYDAIAECDTDPGVKVIVLAAEGPAFCAGHDLKEMTAHRKDDDGGREFFSKTMNQCAAMMQSIVACSKPVIARVHGIATAAGCQLVASCDLAVASEDAKFCTPGVNIGLFCSTPMVALSRNVSRKQAMEMLLLGEMVSAEVAARFGLVNRAVPADKLDGQVMEFARAIAKKSGRTVTIGKKAFYEQLEKPLSEAYDYASEVMVKNMMDADAQEGIGAFLEKREPKWQS